MKPLYLVTFIGFFSWASSSSCFANSVQAPAVKNASDYQRAAALLFGEALVDYKANRNEAAIAKLTEVIQLDPTVPDAFDIRAILYSVAGDYDRAITDYTEEIGLNPKGVAAYQHRGRTYENEKQYDKAIEDFTREIELEPKSPLSYDDRPRAYELVGRNQEALADLQHAISLGANDVTTFLELGIAHCNLGQFDDALADDNQAIRLDPFSLQLAYALSNRGYVYIKMTKFDKALTDLNKAVQLSPKLAPAFFHRAYLSQLKNDLSSAIADYEDAVALDDTIAEAYTDEAIAYLQQGEFQSARLKFAKALSLDIDASHPQWIADSEHLLRNFDLASVSAPTELTDALYQSMVFALIQYEKRFPQSARDRGAHGTAVVQFEVSDDGTVTSIKLSQSSGDAELDEEALAVIPRAAPFPKRPHDVQKVFAAKIAFDPNTSANAAYVMQISKLLKSYSKLPNDLCKRHAQGTTLLHFEVSDDGSIRDVGIVQSSGDSELDMASLANVIGAAPFPKPPPGRHWRFQVPIRYSYVGLGCP